MSISLPKIVFSISLVLFGAISLAALLKNKKNEPVSSFVIQSDPTNISVEKVHPEAVVADHSEILLDPAPISDEPVSPLSADSLPHADRIEQLFQIYGDKLPIVETITYKSHVPWLKGRPAWLADYASHYRTSRHFIARSLNGKPDYFKQEVSNGNRFNVLRQDKNFSFYLLADLQTCRLWFYYHDQDSDERVLLKSYPIGVGRPDASSPSGYLTPTGKYLLGEKVGIYQSNIYAIHKGERTEMVRIFGTRWIPFEKPLDQASHPSKGFGLHGLPWKLNNKDELVEDLDSLGKYTSDGCIRLATSDIEELFSIIITIPTTIELVNGFELAALPGKEMR